MWHQENRKKLIQERLPTEARVKSNNNDSCNDDDDPNDDIFANATKYVSDNIQIQSISEIGMLDNIYNFENDNYEIHTYKPKGRRKREIEECTDVYMECFPDFQEIDVDNEVDGKKKGQVSL